MSNNLFCCFHSLYTLKHSNIIMVSFLVIIDRNTLKETDPDVKKNNQIYIASKPSRSTDNTYPVAQRNPASGLC